MKKLIVSCLSLALLLSSLTIPALAIEKQMNYQTCSFDCRSYDYGLQRWITVRYTFDAVAFGYEFDRSVVWNYIEDSTEPDGYWYIYGDADNEGTAPVVVIKDNSQVKVENIDGVRSSLPAGYANGLEEYALHGYTSDGLVIINRHDPVDHPDTGIRENPVIKSGSVSQLFTPADGEKVTLHGDIAGMDWFYFVLESDMDDFRVRKAGAQQEPASTQYQSTAKLTGAYIGEMDFASFDITVTNPTDARDSGTVCAVLTSKSASIGETASAAGAAVKFIDYDLAPGESKTYTVQSSGIIGITDIGGNNLALVGTALSRLMSCDIITFEDDADRDAYRATVPYEHQWANESEMNCHRLCYGSYGDQWLKNYTGIRDYGIIIDTSGDHSLCKVK